MEWLEEFFSWSPEALDALDSERYWESIPDPGLVGDGFRFFTCSDDTGMWSWCETYLGYEIVACIPYITEYDLFECGDFEFYNRTEMKGPETELEVASRLTNAVAKSHIEYLKWVLETGKDPMHYFSVPRKKEVTENWQYRLLRSIVGTILKDARRNSGGRWLAPEELPQHVKEHFMLDKIGGRWIVFGEMKKEDRPKFEEFFTNGQRLIHKYDGGTWFKDVTEIEYNKPINKKKLRRVLRVRAQRELLRLRKEGNDETS
jgi:hypothetical protein